MDAVAKPQYVYHGTRPPLIHKIVKEGLRSDSGFSNFGGQGGVSVTTDLKAARQFGNAVIVLDPKKLKRAGYTLEPFQHSSAPNESELRVTGRTTPTMIPSDFFEKVISYWRPKKFEMKWWEDNLPNLKLEVASLTRTEAIALTNAGMRVIGNRYRYTERVMSDHIGPFKIGDVIFYGKYKNSRGKIISFGTNHKNQATVIIEPIPKGRKKNKELGLFKIWTMPKVEAETHTDFPECDEMPDAPVMAPWKDDAQLDDWPDHHAEFPPYDEDPEPGQEVEVVHSDADVEAKRTSAKRMVVYHGTSDSVLKPVLSKGLVPGKSKTWESDKGSIISPSRVSYGGIYYAANFLTALASARHAVKILNGKNPIIIEATVQPRSAVVDEDDFKSPVALAMQKAFGTAPSSHGPSIAISYIIMDQGKDRNARQQFADEFQVQMKRKGSWLPKHNNPQSLEAMIDQMYEASLTRLASYVEDGDWVSSDRRMEWSIAQPQKKDAERMYREALDVITKTFRRATIEKEGDFNKTFRMMEPVAYSGRNKITAVVELFDYYNRDRDYDKPLQIKVHKGNPTRLLKEYVKSVGPNYELV